MLLKKRLESGNRTIPAPSAKEAIFDARERVKTQLETIDSTYKRILNPHIYKVSLTEELKDLKLSFIEARLK